MLTRWHLLTFFLRNYFRVITTLTHYSDIFWHSFWHTIWTYLWHIFWHSIWHSLWHGHCRTLTASARSQWQRRAPLRSGARSWSPVGGEERRGEERRGEARRGEEVILIKPRDLHSLAGVEKSVSSSGHSLCRRSSQDVHTAQSQSSGGSFGRCLLDPFVPQLCYIYIYLYYTYNKMFCVFIIFSCHKCRTCGFVDSFENETIHEVLQFVTICSRQKAPSFSWPGTSSFTAEVILRVGQDIFDLYTTYRTYKTLTNNITDI